MTRMRPRTATAAVATVAAALALAIPATGLAAGSRVVLGLGLESAYDDNLLQYSDDQIRLFESGTRPERFSIETTDDGEFRPNVSLAFESERAHHRSTTVRLRVSGSFHVKNETTDNRAASLAWREEFGSRRSLTLSGYRLPRFYLRQLFDEDTTVPYPGLSRYRRAEFGLTTASAAWRERLARRTRLVVNYTFERRAYDDAFRERDSNTHEGGLGFEWSAPKARGGFELSAAYRNSAARAEDADGTAGNDPDVSYRGAVLGAGGRLSLARGRAGRLSADLRYEYRSRDYTSDRPADASHFGRSDRLHDVEIGLRFAPRARVSLRGFYQFEDNRASFASATPPGTDPASYTQNRVGLDIDCGAVLWSRRGTPRIQPTEAP